MNEEREKEIMEKGKKNGRKKQTRNKQGKKENTATQKGIPERKLKKHKRKTEILKERQN